VKLMILKKGFNDEEQGKTAFVKVLFLGNSCWTLLLCPAIKGLVFNRC
jgi:hypothetical protein